MNWKNWLKGLISAMAGGAAGAVGTIIADPTVMTGNDATQKIGTVALITAITHALMYLKQSPLPK